MVTKACKSCQKAFQVKNYRADTAKYCSNRCRKQDKQAPQVVLHCATCGVEFSREIWKTRHSHKGQYCSQKCYVNRSPPQQILCKCGNTFQAYQSRLSYYSQVYCSRKCYMQYGFRGRLTDHEIELDQYELFTRRLRSTANYLRWAQNCLRRDQNNCQSCGDSANLTVHHKKEVIHFIQQYGFNKNQIEQDPLWLNTDNGVTLCRSCHLQHHQGDIDENPEDRRGSI